jgi:beta-galactosidase
MDANKKPKSDKDGENKGGGFSIDFSAISGFMGMLGGFTVLRLTSMVGMANISFTKEELLKMNKKLNKIRKPKKKK